MWSREQGAAETLSKQFRYSLHYHLLFVLVPFTVKRFKLKLEIIILHALVLLFWLAGLFGAHTSLSSSDSYRRLGLLSCPWYTHLLGFLPTSKYMGVNASILPPSMSPMAPFCNTLLTRVVPFGASLMVSRAQHRLCVTLAPTGLLFKEERDSKL